MTRKQNLSGLLICFVFAFISFSLLTSASPLPSGSPAEVLASPDKAHEMSKGVVILLIVLAHITILGLIPLILAAMWKIFEKAGEKGWKSLIPFYSTYILAQIANTQPWVGITAVVVSIASYLLSNVQSLILSGGGTVPLALNLSGASLGLVGFITNIFISLGLAESFGKTTLFGLGLLLLPTIFYPVLAFMGAQYGGKSK